jgi:hypothetical protein
MEYSSSSSSPSPLLVTYQDVDPVIQFKPSSDDWELVYDSNRPLHPTGYGPQGEGNSRRRATSPNASLEFTFFGPFIVYISSSLLSEIIGTSLILYGNSGGSTFRVTMDSVQSSIRSNGDGILAWYENLPAQEHTLRLDVTAIPTEFVFDRAMFAVDIPR